MKKVLLVAGLGILASGAVAIFFVSKRKIDIPPAPVKEQPTTSQNPLPHKPDLRPEKDFTRPQPSIDGLLDKPREPLKNIATIDPPLIKGTLEPVTVIVTTPISQTDKQAIASVPTLPPPLPPSDIKKVPPVSMLQPSPEPVRIVKTIPVEEPILVKPREPLREIGRPSLFERPREPLRNIDQQPLTKGSRFL